MNPIPENKIHCRDALRFTEGMPSESVDLVICDGPYGVTTHEWDQVANIQEFNLGLIERFSRVMKPGAALYLFGKCDCVDFVDYRPFLDLATKIVWYQPSRLAQGRRSYTNNYDIICYFTKGRVDQFNLDDIRVAQLVELEHRRRCENVPSVKNGRYGKTAFNEKGKNPGDVWGDIKQLTYKSKELLSRELLNTVQKPEKLIERLVRASSSEGDLVYDPFCGSGTVPAVCTRLNRRFVACEQNPEYAKIARQRIKATAKAERQLSLL
ncbi:Modification methylase MboII [Rubripirellula obstinata]|uniref:Methyltransferase n=1 Tax=Rubripirellula obstinata TaxID=406547 RepID=A0A5B1CNF7_9BACT|nr:site-specific DNA-methyltransferase [Rubripirellula obstinata]KAA1262076.1 Modification methylase MboII [Rubripirellula obstinata]